MTVVAIASIISSFIAPSRALAANSGITYQGRILKPDGEALEGSQVQFRIQIRTPNNNNCLMYEEVKLPIDMRGSKGLFGVTINDGTGSRADSTGLGLEKIFANRAAFTFDPTTCSSGNSYTPSTMDGRKLAVYFKDETMTTWEPMPVTDVNYVPYAFDAEQVGGFNSDSLLRVIDAGSLGNVSPLSTANYNSLMALIAGTSSQYQQYGKLQGVNLPTLTNGQVLGWAGGVWSAFDPLAGLPTFARTALPVCNAGEFLRDNGSGLLVCATPASSGGTVTAITAGAGLTGGTITTTGTIALPVLGAGGTAVKVTYDTFGRITAAGSLAEADIPTLVTAGKVSGDAINTGTIGGNAAVNTSGNITTSGAVNASAVTASTLSTNAIRVFETTNNFKVTIVAPGTLGADYTMTLPGHGGAPGQVLTTDGSGSLTWSNTAVTGITSLTGDVTASGTGAVSATLSNTGVTSGTYGSSSTVPTFTVDSKGRLTAAGSVTITGTLPGGTAGGDLGGTYPNPSVDRIRGMSVNAGTLGPADAGKAFVWQGTEYQSQWFGIHSLKTAAGANQFASAGCNANQTLTWTALNDVFTCVDIAGLNASVITTGTLSASVLPIVPVAKGGTNSPTALFNNRIVITSGGAVVEAPALLDGQLLIGQTGGAPLPGTLTAGPGISISNGAGSITISASGAGAALTNGRILVGNASNIATEVVPAGDATLSNTGNVVITANAVTTTKIADDNVTFAKLQNINTNRIVGRSTAGAGDAEEISLGAGLTLANGTLAATVSSVIGSSLTDSRIWIGDAGNVAQSVSLSGDATVNNAGVVTITANAITGAELANDAVTTAKIADQQVTFAKLQNVNSSRILGRSTAGAGVAEEIALGAGLTLTNGTLASVVTSVTGSTLTDARIWVGDAANSAQPVLVSGDATMSNAGAFSITANAVTTVKIADDQVTFAKLQNVNTNRILGRSTASAGDIEELQLGGGISLAQGTLGLVVGGGLAITNGTLAATGGGGDFYRDGSVSMTGQLQTIGGSSLAPGYTFGGDTDTGLFNPGADSLAISTGGQHRLVVGANGVGIGTDSPQDSLHIIGSANGSGAGHIRVQNTYSGGGGLGWAGLSAAANNSGVSTEFGHSSSTYTAYPVIGGQAGFVYGGGSGGLALVTQSGSMRFATGGGSLSDERMRIAADGDVAIGTTAALSKLHVAGGAITAGSQSSSLGGEVRFQEVGGSGENYVALRAPAALAADVTWTLPSAEAAGSGYALVSNGAGSLAWQSLGGGGDFFRSGSASMTGQFLAAHGSSLTPGIAFSHDTDTGIYNAGADTLAFSTAGAQRMTIASTGNVGIGTTTPGEKLDVNGGVRIGASTGANAGTLRWTGTNFQGFDGTAWQNLIVNAPASGACDTTQTYNAPGVHSYTVPASFATITIKVWGAGGAGGSARFANGNSGGSSSISSLGLSAGGGGGGNGGGGGYGVGGGGGSASGGTTNSTGSTGATAAGGLTGDGASAPGGGGSGGTGVASGSGNAGATPGGGGSGGAWHTDPNRAGGGGSGGYVEKTFTTATLSPGANINDVLVGAGGTALSGDGGNFGGTGGHGQVSIICSTTGTPPVNNRGIVFLDSGAHSSNANFVYDVSGNLGVGTANPQARLDLGQGGIRMQDQTSTVGYSISANSIANDNRLIIASTGTNWGTRLWLDTPNAQSGFSMAVNGTEKMFFGADTSFGYLRNYETFRFLDQFQGIQGVITQSGDWGIGTSSPLSRLSVHGGAISAGSQSSTLGGEVRMYDLGSSGNNFVAFRAPVSIAADTTWTLPSTDGSSGQVLQTNGSGSLTWGTSGSGDFMANGSVPMTGQLVAGTGSAAAPSITFTGDTNSGFFSFTDNAFSITTNGQERIRFSNNGAQSMQTGAWSLSGGVSATFPSYTFENDTDTGMYRAGVNSLAFATAGTQAMTISSIGSVGIGTTSPTKTLHVNGQAYVTGDMWLTDPNANGSGGSKLRLASGNYSPEGNYIWANSFWTEFVAYAAQGWMFKNENGTELIRFQGDGKVGIGTSTPAEKLDVNGGIKIGNSTMSNAGSIRWTGTNFQGYDGSTWFNFVPNPVATGGCDTTVTYNGAGVHAYTVPATFATITIKVWGGGGGGGPAFNGVASGSGGNSTISSLGLSAGGGGGGVQQAGPVGLGGVATGGTTNTNGASGDVGINNTSAGSGGTAPNGGAGGAGSSNGFAGGIPGGGGGGGLCSWAGSGGGSGGYTEKTYTTATLPPGTTINDIVVGAGGSAGIVGTGCGANGNAGAGGTGQVTVTCSTTGSPPANNRGVLFLDSGAYTSNSNFVFDTSNNLAVGTNTSTTNAKLTVAGPIVSVPRNVASGATVDLSASDTITLTSLGTSTIDLSNMAHGGEYTLVIEDTTSRTYTFNGCTTTKFKPANAATTSGTHSIYNILTVSDGGGGYNCYVTWASGYQ